MDLIHFSRTPLTRLQPIPPQSPTPSPKPHGVWVSDESQPESWSAWCRGEGFRLDALACRTRLHLVPDHRLCVLTTPPALRRFSTRYGTALHGLTSLMAVDWQAVAQAYQGVLITPYQWRLRLDPRTYWYYGFDCAGGCLWDVAAIDRLEGVISP